MAGGNQDNALMGLASGPSPASPTLPTPVSGGPNGLMRPGGEGPNSPAPTGSPASPTPSGRKGPMDEIVEAHDYAKFVHDTFAKAQVMLQHMRREMDNLVKKGDTVQPPDVVAAAGRLVGHGLNAKEMAAILVDMPPMGGQGLAAWLATHDQAIQQQEAHVEVMKQLTGHNMMQSAFKVIAALHLRQRAQQFAGGMAAQMGALGPRPPTAEAGQGPAMTNVLQATPRSGTPQSGVSGGGDEGAA